MQRLSKKQKQAKAKRLAEELALELSAKRLKEKWENIPTFSSRLPSTKPKKQVAKLLLPPLIQERISDVRKVPSLKTAGLSTGKPLPVKYEGEMALREKRAREKKHVVAPISNKGGLQLIVNPDDFKTMGRKV